jgi:hypothetical protein
MGLYANSAIHGDLGATVGGAIFGAIMGYTTVKHRPINDLFADKQDNASFLEIYCVR